MDRFVLNENATVTKNVFMIMCHKNAPQVLRLAKKCLTDDSDVIIHADVLMPKEEYDLFEKAAAEYPNLFLTDKRIHGELDRPSCVHIAMELIHKANCIQRETGNRYRYFCLISGQDYPIKPIEYINRQLKETYPKPYIDCTPYDRKNWMYKKYRWNPITNKIRLKIDDFFKGKKRHPIRVGLMVMLLTVSKLMGFIVPSMYHQVKNHSGAVYGGAAWWMLPDVAIQYIYNEYKSSSKLVTLLLQAVTPEDLFFQNMSMQSPVKDMIELNSKETVTQNCRTWAYFFDDDKPPVSHPYTFTVNEFEKLKKSDRWFARKFDDTRDPQILDMLDEYCSTFSATQIH